MKSVPYRLFGYVYQYLFCPLKINIIKFKRWRRNDSNEICRPQAPP